MSGPHGAARLAPRIKTGFAVNHLIVAVHAARNAHSIEQANAEEPLGAWFDGMMREVPVSVVMAGAALEAAVNEIIQELLDGGSPLYFCPDCGTPMNCNCGLKPVAAHASKGMIGSHPERRLPSKGRLKLLAELKDEHSGNSLSKFRRLARLMDFDPDTGTETWENASMLVQLRNYFMHFRRIPSAWAALFNVACGRSLRS
jgi:hypothetical protein